MNKSRNVELKYTPEEIRLAKIIRDEWAAYATETLPNPPAGFTKSWEDTGDWGKEGNLRVVRRLLREIKNEST